MNTFQACLLSAVVLTTTACASNNAPLPPASSTTYGAPADAAVVATPGVAGQNTRQSTEAGEQPPVADPWEGFNRKMHTFNNTADRLVLRPLAVGYKAITPEPVRDGVSRFFANLGTPVTAANQALQGRPGDAAVSLGRFAVNTTIGVVGLFDPATRLGMPENGDEDFGQTLATWGWQDSRYLVLPLLGPRTVRDAVGIVGDQPFSPAANIQDSGTATTLQALELVDVRTQMLPIDKFRRDALDDYIFVRDAWSQRRNSQIRQASPDAAEQ